MENKYTSGPWFAVEYGGWWNIQDGPYYEDRNIMNEELCDKAEANSNLAATAPDLLEALKILESLDKQQNEAYEILNDSGGTIDASPSPEDWKQAFAVARAAISKATT